MLGCSLLLSLQGICGANRMDAQPLVQRPPTEPARHGVIILILLRRLITMLAVNFAFNHRPWLLDVRATLWRECQVYSISRNGLLCC